MNRLPLAATAGIFGVTGFTIGRNSGRIKEAVTNRVRTSAEHLGFLAYLTAVNRSLPTSEDRKLAAAACRHAEYGWPGLYDLITSEEEREPILVGGDALEV